MRENTFMNSCNYNHNIYTDENIICLGKTKHIESETYMNYINSHYVKLKTLESYVDTVQRCNILQDRQEISSSLKSL